MYTLLTHYNCTKVNSARALLVSYWAVSGTPSQPGVSLKLPTLRVTGISRLNLKSGEWDSKGPDDARSQRYVMYKDGRSRTLSLEPS
jgi:hypothetical protein